MEPLDRGTRQGCPLQQDLHTWEGAPETLLVCVPTSHRAATRTGSFPSSPDFGFSGLFSGYFEQMDTGFVSLPSHAITAGVKQLLRAPPAHSQHKSRRRRTRGSGLTPKLMQSI